MYVLRTGVWVVIIIVGGYGLVKTWTAFWFRLLSRKKLAYRSRKQKRKNQSESVGTSDVIVYCVMLLLLLSNTCNSASNSYSKFSVFFLAGQQGDVRKDKEPKYSGYEINYGFSGMRNRTKIRSHQKQLQLQRHNRPECGKVTVVFWKGYGEYNCFFFSVNLVNTLAVYIVYFFHCHVDGHCDGVYFSLLCTDVCSYMLYIFTI